MYSNGTKTEKAGKKNGTQIKTIRGDMLVLQCQLERELIRMCGGIFASRRSQSSQTISSLPLCASCTTMWKIRSFRRKW